MLLSGSVSRSAGAHQQYDMFDYFGLFGVGHSLSLAETPSHTLDSSVLAGPASFLGCGITKAK